MKIFVTPKAEKKLLGIWEFIRQEFGEKSADSFKSKTFRVLQTLSSFPEMGVLEEPTRQIRSFPVSTKTRVFYRIKDQSTLVVLTFFDVRLHPSKKLN